ncbi:MAG: hypothetical protein ACFFBM_07700 [Promethearchaeota archaeon]
MREDSLVLVTSQAEQYPTPLPFSNTSAESLWDTAKNSDLHLLLREPALVELARRKDPGLLSFCEYLVSCGDQECWFTGIKVLASLGTHEAVQRLLAVSGSLNPWDRKIVIQTVATVLTSAQREAFRRVVRLFAVPGKLDVTGWTATALRVLQSVCEECGILLLSSSPDLQEFAEIQQPRLTSA